MKFVIVILVLFSILYMMCTLCFVHATQNFFNRKVESLKKYVYFEKESDKKKHLQNWQNELKRLPLEFFSLI